MAGLTGLPGTTSCASNMRFKHVQGFRKTAPTHPAPDVEPARSLPEGSVKVRHLALFLFDHSNHSTSPELPSASLV